MPQNSNFRLPRGYRFWRKLDVSVMAPNHGGDPLGSILGPMGFHWGQKMGQNHKKLPCPKIRILGHGNFLRFWPITMPRWSISAKIGNYGYGAKSQWGPPRVHLVNNGAKKWVKTVKNYHAPKFEFSTTPPRSSISAKIGPYGYGAKSRWGPPRVHLVANGVPLGPRNGSKP